MRMPDSLEPLADYGIIDEVIRPLMSGKEAQIYLVRSAGEERVAKVYKQAEHRNFKHRAEYTEGRNTRSSRDQRAMAKRSRYGRSQDEAAWKAAEVDMIYRLDAAGVRVPKPFHFSEGVLIMELVKGADGLPAPRLGDMKPGPREAAEIYERLLREVVRMLCAGVVHGDLSEFNVLVDADGPVVIDFPQAVDASANPSARKLLLRDVENLHRFLARSSPGRRTKPYAQEMWELYQSAKLQPDTPLTGNYRAPRKKVDIGGVMGLVADADRDEQRRRQSQGDAPRRRRPRRRRPASAGESRPVPPATPARSATSPPAEQAGSRKPVSASPTAPPAKRRRRRRRRRKPGAQDSGS